MFVSRMCLLAISQLSFTVPAFRANFPTEAPTWACATQALIASNGTVPALRLHAHEQAAPFGEQSVQAHNQSSLASLLGEKKTAALIVFYAPWCPHCQTFVMHDGSGNQTNAPLETFNREMIALNGPKVIKFDGHASKPPAQFDVKYYPMVYFVSKEGVATAYDGDPHELSELRSFALSGRAVSLGVKARALKEGKQRLDINQKVYIENAAVLGDGAGDGALNVCRSFTDAHVANPAAPTFKVCGTGIKATIFLRGRCEAYYEHSVTVGKCDSGMPAETCDVYSPADQAAFGHYQSYKIEQC